MKRVPRRSIPASRHREFSTCAKCCCCCWCCYFGNSPRTTLEDPYYTCTPSVESLGCVSLRRSIACRCFCGFFHRIGKCGRAGKRFFSKLLSQPLDRIAAYFGEMVGFYFAWLEFYTHWLVLPAIAGGALFVFQVWYGSVDAPYVPLFSLFMALWSTLFLEFWRRRNAILAHRWGVLNYEEEESTRPQFKGTWVQDPITGEISKMYSSLKRAAKYAITIPVVLLAVFGIVMLLVYVFATRDSALQGVDDSNSNVPSNPFTRGLGDANTTEPSKGDEQGGKGRDISVNFGGIDLSNVIEIESETTLWWVAMILPAVVYGFLIPLFDMCFGKVAVSI